MKIALCRHRVETTKCSFCNQFKCNGASVVGVLNEAFSVITLKDATPSTPSTPLLLTTLLHQRSNPHYNSGNVVLQ